MLDWISPLQLFNTLFLISRYRSQHLASFLGHRIGFRSYQTKAKAPSPQRNSIPDYHMLDIRRADQHWTAHWDGEALQMPYEGLVGQGIGHVLPWGIRNHPGVLWVGEGRRANWNGMHCRGPVVCRVHCAGLDIPRKRRPVNHPHFVRQHFHAQFN